MNPRIGIIGGGQLARMMVPPAARLGFEVWVLDPTPSSPAGQLAHRQITAGFDDTKAIKELVSACDVTTYDLEGIEVGPLIEMQAAGHQVLPEPRVLATIQDKLLQKEALQAHGLPSAPYQRVDNPGHDAFARFGYPLVQKARRGGYDGRGVAIIAGPEASFLPVASYVEHLVPYDRELAVCVARSTTGEVRSYDPVEMVFTDTNILDHLQGPAQLSPTLAAKARSLAETAIKAFGGVGIFGVEMFLVREDLLINEIAPRTHNSGHHTIEACLTSQFEQHLRAILGLPLGDPTQHHPAVMKNLIAQGDPGPVRVVGMHEALAVPGVSVHLYGKTESRPGRKMGHLTAVADTLALAQQRAETAAGHLNIQGAS